MGTFSRIFGTGDKELQERAEECLLKLSKALQSASAKMRVAAEVWVEGEYHKLDELEKEVIALEREADRVKEDLVENILSKRAFLPQQAQERHNLSTHLDGIIDAAEDAVRMMAVGKGMRPPREIEDIAEKCWICTDLLQDAVKYLFTDFKKSVEITRQVDHVREEARDLQYDLLKKLFSEPKYKPPAVHFYKSVSERVLEVAIKAELAGDFIRELAIKYA
jgi:predicted phosphate transport protein (TIGR00153 family)